MMHVVHTVGSLGDQHGGPSRSITALCSALADADPNLDVELFTLEDADPSSHPIPPSSRRVRVHTLPGHQADFRSARRLERAVAQAVQPHRSVIHEHGMWLPANHATARAAASMHTPRMVSPRGMLSRWALDFRRWKKRLVWALYQRRDLLTAAVVHVTSADEAEEARASGVTQPIAVIPNGVEVPPAARRRSDIGNGKRRALFLSRIHPKKGVLELVEAWSRVRPCDWELLVAGPDDQGHRAEVEAAVERHGLSEAVTFAGPVSDGSKWALYAGADLFVLPTFSENFGIVIAEALASGLPVITTRGAPWPGITAHGCGWWTEVGVEAVEAALREATSLDNEQLRDRGRRGREFVLREFSWRRVSEEMRAVYAWMLEGGAQPPSVILDR